MWQFAVLLILVLIWQVAAGIKANGCDQTQPDPVMNGAGHLLAATGQTAGNILNMAVAGGRALATAETGSTQDRFANSGNGANTVKNAESGTASFSGDAPNFSPDTMLWDDKTNTVSTGDWGEALQSMSLEPEVAQSHKRFVQDRKHVSSGAGIASVRDDIETPNRWAGLRRPDFRVKVDANARTVPTNSENDDLLPAPTKLRWL